MAKKAIEVQGDAEGIMSLKDAGYQHARHLDRAAAYQRRVLELCGVAGFDSVTAEQKAEIYSGFQMRFAENHPPVMYMLEGADTLVPVSGEVPKGRDTIRVDVHYAMSFTSHEFGQMGKDRPNLKAIIGEVRDAFSTYASGCWSALTKKSVKRERGATLEFIARLKKVGETLEKQNKVALSKGDPSAVGVEAFKAAWRDFLKAVVK